MEETPLIKLIDLERASRKTKGEVREWPSELSTSHLTNLSKSKGRLLVEITDSKWSARIQASESIELSAFWSLMKDNETEAIRVAAVKAANQMITDALLNVKEKSDTSLLSDLGGFLQRVSTYIMRGQAVNATDNMKSTFLLMARNNFSDIYHGLLSKTEQ